MILYLSPAPPTQSRPTPLAPPPPSLLAPIPSLSTPFSSRCDVLCNSSRARILNLGQHDLSTVASAAWSQIYSWWLNCCASVRLGRAGGSTIADAFGGLMLLLLSVESSSIVSLLCPAPLPATQTLSLSVSSNTTTFLLLLTRML